MMTNLTNAYCHIKPKKNKTTNKGLKMITYILAIMTASNILNFNM